MNPWDNDPVANAPQAAPQPATAPSDAPWANDATATADAPPAASGGFTDEEKQAILHYLPKAKDAADLEQFASELTNGRAHIGNAADVIAARDKGHRQFAWEAPTVAKPEPVNVSPSARDQIGEAILGGLDTAFPGVGTFLRSLRDNGSGAAAIAHVANAAAADYGSEVGGFLDTVAHPSQYGDFGTNLDRNVEHGRAQLHGLSAGHPIASTVGELAGVGLTAPLAGEAVAGTKLAELPGAVKAATGGAIYGSGAGGPGHRVAGAVTGAALGAATDVAAPFVIKGATAAAKAVFGSSAGKVANAEFAHAADRQGVDYMAADLPHSPKSKFATALSSLTFGGIPLAEQGGKNIATAATAAGKAASDVGTVTDKTGAGLAAQKGAQSFVDSTAAKLNSLEANIPIASTAPATVSNTRAALSSLKQLFSSNPKLAAAFSDPRISAYLDALTPQTTKEATGVLDASGNPITRDVTHGGGLSWQDLRDFRTRVGQIIGQPGLTSDGAQIAQLRHLYGALSDDIRATAMQNGPKALAAWTRWNNYARARSDRINNVVSMILGPNQDKAPQSAFEAMQRLANEKGGDPLKLARALRSMPDEEANTVRATIIDGLGDASPGRQNASGDVFSPAEWVTNWNKISNRAKNVLFTGDHRKALDDLALLFSGMKSSTKFANSSKTGLFVAATHTAALSIANPVLGALDAGLQYGGGKLLANPTFARKLAATPMSSKGAAAFWSRPWVKAMQLKNPAIAGEIQAFQHAFLAANDNSINRVGAIASPDAQGNQPNQ